MFGEHSPRIVTSSATTRTRVAACDRLDPGPSFADDRQRAIDDEWAPHDTSRLRRRYASPPAPARTAPRRSSACGPVVETIIVSALAAWLAPWRLRARATTSITRASRDHPLADVGPPSDGAANGDCSAAASSRDANAAMWPFIGALMRSLTTKTASSDVDARLRVGVIVQPDRVDVRRRHAARRGERRRGTRDHRSDRRLPVRVTSWAANAGAEMVMRQ